MPSILSSSAKASPFPIGAGRAHGGDEGPGRAVVPGQQPRRGLAHMGNAERVDEAVELHGAARLDGVEQFLAEVSPHPSRSASFDEARLSRLARVKMSGGDWINPSS